MRLPIARAALVAALCALTIAACTTYTPVVDKGQPGHDEAKYQGDLAYCRQLAEQAGGGVGGAAKSGGIGAVAGAAVGALLGAITGDAGRGAATGAVIGATGGVAKGAAEDEGQEKKVLRNCMLGRGWKVLN